MEDRLKYFNKSEKKKENNFEFTLILLQLINDIIYVQKINYIFDMVIWLISLINC